MINANVHEGRAIPITSSSLLVRIQTGVPDNEAWQRFVALYTPLVLGWCRHRLQNADAEDVTQEVLRSVHRAVGKFERGKNGGTLRGWLRTITNRAISDLIRSRAQEIQGVGGSDCQTKMLTVPESPQETDPARDHDEERFLLQQALKDLLAGYKDHTRAAFWQIVVEGRSPADVARELGVKEHVVYLAKSRVLKRLKEEYGDLLDL